MNQTTLKRNIAFSGIGLHSGEVVSCTLRPANEHSGIQFHVHTPSGIVDIVPSPDCISATSLATTLSKDKAAVSTVEHLLAALRGLSIDNVHIDVEGREIPILDGSSLPFIDAILDAGIVSQEAQRYTLRVTSPFKLIGNSGKAIYAEPYDGFFIDYSIDFPHPAIGVQRKQLEISPTSFLQIAKARTFGFLKDAEALRAHGLALGGGLDNAIILDDTGILNEEGLRFTDEFVRHKMLDFIGDMAVLPLPLSGKFTVNCSGHALNNEFAKAALASGKLVPSLTRDMNSLNHQQYNRQRLYANAALMG